MSIDNVTDIEPLVQYAASASQEDFDYGFPIFEDADLVVDVDGVVQALGTDYTVSGEGDDTGGTVTFLSAMIGGEIVSIYRDIEIARTTDIQQNGPWSSSDYNDEQDKTYLLLQDLKRDTRRALRIPLTAEVNSDDLELPVSDFAGKFLSFDADGKPTPAVLSDTTVTQSVIGELLYPLTDAESDVGTTPQSFVYPDGDSQPANTFRYIAPAQATFIKAGNTASQSAGAVTTGVQLALDTYLSHEVPRGNYKLSSALAVRPWTKFKGLGMSDIFVWAGEEVTGTRIVQSAATFALTTDVTGGDEDDSVVGHVVLEDFTVLGGILNEPAATYEINPIGTYGIRISSSDVVRITRVAAAFFTLSGFRLVGSLLAHMQDCEAQYNQDYGVRFDYGLHGTGESTNSYISTLNGGRFSQNKNGGILLGTSSVRITLEDFDCESNGRFYSTGTGYGVYAPGELRAAVIRNAWFEDNKLHIVIGDVAASPSLVTVSEGVVIEGNEFGATNGGGAAITFNTGYGHIVRSNEFSAGSIISIGNYSDNPLIENNVGNPVVLDGNSNKLTVDSKDMTNNFPYLDLTAWTTTNCSVAKVYVPSPAGFVPVYKVTPTAPGAVQLESPNAAYTFLTTRQTLGCYMRSDAASALSFWPLVKSVNMGKFYTAQETDVWSVGSKWVWRSIGRSIASTDTGNQAFTFVVTAATTDPFYITGFSSRSGLCYDPFILPSNTVQTLTGAGAVDLVSDVTHVVTTSANALTLEDGVEGQEKLIVMKTDAGDGTLTPTNLANGTTITFNDVDDFAKLQFANGSWFMVGGTATLA